MGEVLFFDGEKSKKKRVFQGKFRLVNASQCLSSICLERQGYVSGGDARSTVLISTRLTFLDMWRVTVPSPPVVTVFRLEMMYGSHFLAKGL